MIESTLKREILDGLNNLEKWCEIFIGWTPLAKWKYKIIYIEWGPIALHFLYKISWL